MSMHNMGVNYYGVVVKTSEINFKEFQGFFGFTDEDMENEEWRCSPVEYDKITIFSKTYISGEELSGEFIPLLYQGYFDEIDIDKDDWVIFELPRYPSLFEAVYKDAEDLIQQMKALYERFIDVKDFDWHNRAIHLRGSVYC